MNQSKLEANTCSWHEARKNVRQLVTIGFGFTLDWLRKWLEIFKPITKRSNAKPKQTQFTFDAQVKTALKWEDQNNFVKKNLLESSLSKTVLRQGKLCPLDRDVIRIRGFGC